MGQRSILLVDTPAGPLRPISASLQQNGCAVHVAESTREALELAMERLPDVVVLSPQLEETELLDLCRSLLRNLGPDVSPAILIAPDATAAAETTGANSASQMAQSLALDLLAQCVRTLTFRTKFAGETETVLECHGVRLDSQTGVAELDGQPLDLTPTEFRLLQTLVAQPGHVLSRQQLEEALGSAAGEGSPGPSTGTAESETASRKRRIDVHIQSIRGKLARQGALIETVRGVGYRFREPAWDANAAP